MSADIFASSALNNYRTTPDLIKIKDHAHRPLMTKHNIAALTLAMQKTEKKYGPFRFEIQKDNFNTDRLFKELSKSGGKRRANVHITVTNALHEKRAHVIRIPVRMGLLSYRLIATRRDFVEKFSEVENLDDLKDIPVGTVESWGTTRILRRHQFNYVAGHASKSIFLMLGKERYDYLLRGVNEVYGDLEKYKQYGDFVIAPSIMVYMPGPYYVFVAPAEKRLIARISEGLELAVQDGSFRALFLEYYQPAIDRAEIDTRNIFYVSNPELEGHPALLRPDMWYLHKPELAEALRQSF